VLWIVVKIELGRTRQSPTKSNFQLKLVKCMREAPGS
jgi:hypothetical protein